MMIKPLLFLFILFPYLPLCLSQEEKETEKTGAVIYSRQDSLLAVQILSRFTAEGHKPTAELLVEIGKTFLGTPYVAYTLENGPEEKLVVNLRELDCTTFAENCLALALTLQSEDPGFTRFTKELERIRYRNGKRNGYLSRLHYFSEWISGNTQKGIVWEPLTSFGTPLDIRVNFMSTHPDRYEVLKNHPDLVPVMAEQEKNLSSGDCFFLEKDAVAREEAKLQEGNIIGITTSIAGLDIAHVGILVRREGRIHLLHASTASGEVIISDEPLADYLQSVKSFTGIRIARPGQP